MPSNGNKPALTTLLIAGLGISGYEAALLALDKGAKVVVLDTQTSPLLIERKMSLEKAGATVHLAVDPGNCQLNFTPELIVISPGIDPLSKFGELLKKMNGKIVSELEFASRFISVPLIGVTGTNGKTTTVELVTHCLNVLDYKAIAAGNIGYALCRVARETQPYDYIVVEVSSFQLEAIESLHFKASVLLNISSDHVDRYPSYDDYGNTKIKIINCSDYPSISLSVLKDGWEIPAKKMTVISLNHGEADIWFDKNKIIFEQHSFPYPTANLTGKHNAENLMATISLLKDCGIAPEKVYQAALLYKTAPHRMQFLGKVNNISFYNDSKATNPHAMITALESLGHTSPKNIRLIAGGRDKKMDFNIANKAIDSYVIKVYIYGECSPLLEKVWKDIVRCDVYKSFHEAVEGALKEITSGEILLLSPGCASLDSFKSYEERGNKFIKIIEEWTKNEK